MKNAALKCFLKLLINKYQNATRKPKLHIKSQIKLINLETHRNQLLVTNFLNPTNTQKLFLGKFLRAGLSTYTALMLSSALLLTSVKLQEIDINTPPVYLQNKYADYKITTLLSVFFNFIKAYYRVRYTRLNRKIRKIVKNKYKYQKQYVWLLPRQRNGFILNLLKACTLIQPHKTEKQRLAATLTEHFLNLKKSPITQLVEQHQKTTIGQLVQKKK